MRTKPGAAGLLVVDLVLERDDGLADRVGCDVTQRAVDQRGNTPVTRRDVLGATDRGAGGGRLGVVAPDVTPGRPRLDLGSPTRGGCRSQPRRAPLPAGRPAPAWRQHRARLDELHYLAGRVVRWDAHGPGQLDESTRLGRWRRSAVRALGGISSSARTHHAPRGWGRGATCVLHCDFSLVFRLTQLTLSDRWRPVKGLRARRCGRRSSRPHRSALPGG